MASGTKDGDLLLKTAGEYSRLALRAAEVATDVALMLRNFSRNDKSTGEAGMGGWPWLNGEPMLCEKPSDMTAPEAGSCTDGMFEFICGKAATGDVWRAEQLPSLPRRWGVSIDSSGISFFKSEHGRDVLDREL
jgi:hypothetical protein